MVSLAVKLNWDVATILHGRSKESLAMVEVLRELAANESICIVQNDDKIQLPAGVFSIGSAEEGGY